MSLSISTWIYLVLLVSFSRGDPCASRPCRNKGVCTSSDGVSYVCKCTKGYFGKRCEIQNKACKDNPCEQGVCQEDAFGDFHCYCSPGYHGKFCQLNNDDCLSSPCQNLTSCIDKVDDYDCLCKGDTFGKHCELHQAEIETCAKKCPQGSICWRNHSITVDIPWGYGDNICNTQHSCFGGQNSSTSEKNQFDYFIDVQLHPVQIQLGDILNFTSDDSIAAAVSGLMPRLLPVDVYGNSDSFVNCNTTNGSQLVNNPQHSIIINSSELLYVGLHYFIMNIDVTYRCDFGLRLNISVKEQVCQNPQSPDGVLCSNQGQCHTNFNMREYQCICCGGFRGKYCEKRDYCFANPCQNKAVCINNNKNAGNYTCNCQPGYEGKHCSIVTNMCLSHPCRNGAICHQRVNSYNCQCQPGYTGRNCKTIINECLSQPCKNNGTCTDRIADFSCTCPKGFTGSQCEVNINECESNPCQHGVCIDKINAFQCLCHPGYTGPECGSHLNECTSKTCLNGGVCIHKATDHACACGIGYEGNHCENDIDLCKKPEICNNFQVCTDKGSHVDCICKAGFTGSNCGVNIDDCTSQPCYFGGKCQDNDNGFLCLCAPGYEGKICDQVNETFHDTAMLHIKIITEDCYKLQDPTIIQQFQKRVAVSVGTSCKCPFTEHNILNQSISLKCHDKISGSLYLRITGAGQYHTEQLICIHQLSLEKKKNIASLDNNTFEVGVVYNDERCFQVNRKLGNIHTGDGGGGDTIALTVGLVFSLLVLFTAAFFVFLRWRKATTPAKRQKSDDKQLVDTINLDLLSAIAPTPKSLYRTSGAAQRNHGLTSHNFDPIDPKSKRI